MSMKKGKKLLSLLLCCVMCLTIIPVSVFAQAIQPKGITSLTGQDLVDAKLIEDINFANAIADSINADPVFYSGKQMSDFDSLEEMLNDYNGIINAQNKGIVSIKGFHHIRKAKEVHLENNQISDITPIAYNVTEYPGDIKSWYGFGEVPNLSNTVIHIKQNPITSFAHNMGGQLAFDKMSSDSIGLNYNFSFLSNGNTVDFVIKFPVDIFCDGQPIQMEKTATIYDGWKRKDGTFCDVDVTNFKMGSNLFLDTDILYNQNIWKISGVQNTGYSMATFSQAKAHSFSWWGTDGLITSFNDTTTKWRIFLTSNIYNQIKLTNEINTNHTITFTKTGKDGAKLPGAVYELYQEMPDGDVLKDTYTTGPDGTFTVPADVLSNGTFYLLEKTAPAGYAVNPEKVYVNLTGGTVEVTSDTGNTITTNDGQTQKTESIDGNGTFALGGFYTDEEGVEHYNDDIQLKVTPPEGGALKTLTVHRTAGKGTEATKTFTAAEVENGTALTYIKNAVKEYANVEISADFEMNVSASQSDEPSSSFKITKETKGGTSSTPFTFEVELTKDGQPYTGSYTIDGVAGTDKDGSFSVEVKAGEAVVIGGLPVGTEYKVSEQAVEGWEIVTPVIEGTTVQDIVADGVITPQTSADFVNIKIPELSYTIEKERVTPAKLKPGTADKYGFEEGDEVAYAVTVENTGDSPLSMDVTDVFADPSKFSNLSMKSVEGDGVVKNSDLTNPVGVNITVPAGKIATVTFTATVATDVELFSGAAADDGKGYENTAETSNVKGVVTNDDGSQTIYSSNPQNGEKQYPDNPDGTNPLDPQEDTATTPIYKADEGQPPVEPEEPADPEPSNPDNPNQPTDPSRPENPGTSDDNPENPDEPGKPDIPQTGDESNPALYFAFMGAGLIGLAASFFLKKKQQRQAKRRR
ncbi:SpaA isopeptide-forming pilin-related protein [Hydrogeniiclostridium mannosilyticum]|uniref:DUF7601 domain-containing protein n=1 Tax=Hydrogeniiclostridium mannosilyticum TaxID=2764322 RepID=UPI00399B713C